MRRPIIIGVGGYTSNVGKTSLVCELLSAFPGWEAIKTTRGHYRSCGKDPVACCVSHLLSDEPLIRSGREETFEVGKDTGRYWNAGASNVHWLICTDDQVEKGIKLTLERVESEGVFVEGNSFAQFVPTDSFVMVRRGESDAIKKSAKSVLGRASAIYLSSLDHELPSSSAAAIGVAPVYRPEDLPALINQLREATKVRIAS